MGVRFARSAGCRCGLFSQRARYKRSTRLRMPAVRARAHRSPNADQIKAHSGKDRTGASAGPAAPYIWRKQRTTMCAETTISTAPADDPPAPGAGLSSRKPPRSISSTTNPRELAMRSQNGSSDLSHRTSWCGLVRALRTAIFSCWPEPRERRYRPERHYMRGPGPKWRAKHRHFG